MGCVGFMLEGVFLSLSQGDFGTKSLVGAVIKTAGLSFLAECYILVSYLSNALQPNY